MRGLKDKVAIVTGAGRGLGRATALRLAQEGVHVLVNDINARDAETTARMVRDVGVRAAISEHDVSDHAAATAMIGLAPEVLGGLDALVNNAGILRDGMLSKLSEQDFDKVIAVNLKGVFNCTQAAVKVMRDAGTRGSIVNIASISYLGNIGQTNYSAAKAGVAGMTRTWGLELARHNIRVNAIAPGLMETEMTKGIPEKILASMVERIPAGRMGRPEELAALVAYLASEDASYVTGQIIHLCGGSSVGGM